MSKESFIQNNNTPKPLFHSGTQIHISPKSKQKNKK